MAVLSSKITAEAVLLWSGCCFDGVLVAVADLEKRRISAVWSWTGCNANCLQPFLADAILGKRPGRTDVRNSAPWHTL